MYMSPVKVNIGCVHRPSMRLIRSNFQQYIISEHAFEIDHANPVDFLEVKFTEVHNLIFGRECPKKSSQGFPPSTYAYGPNPVSGYT